MTKARRARLLRVTTKASREARPPSPTRSWPPWPSRASQSQEPSRPKPCCRSSRPRYATPLISAPSWRPRSRRSLMPIPLAHVLTSMPGVGVRTAARILLDVGDASVFPTPGHLAAYAGLAPVTRRYGTSIRGEFPAPQRQHTPQTSPLPVRVRRPTLRPHQQGLLRPQTSPGQEAQRRPHLPRTTTLRRPPRHAPEPRPLPNTRARCRLTRT